MSLARIGVVIVVIIGLIIAWNFAEVFYKDRYLKKDWETHKTILEKRSKNLCARHNMIYAGYEMTAWQTWKAICVAESPLKVETYGVTYD